MTIQSGDNAKAPSIGRPVPHEPDRAKSRIRGPSECYLYSAKRGRWGSRRYLSGCYADTVHWASGLAKSDHWVGTLATWKGRKTRCQRTGIRSTDRSECGGVSVLTPLSQLAGQSTTPWQLSVKYYLPILLAFHRFSIGMGGTRCQISRGYLSGSRDGTNSSSSSLPPLHCRPAPSCWGTNRPPRPPVFRPLWNPIGSSATWSGLSAPMGQSN
jgi:hypothetical protein